MSNRTEDLKPCPFCGGEASAEGHQYFGDPLRSVRWADGAPITEAFFANCPSCGASTIGNLNIGQRTRGEAVERWNKRSASANDQWARTARHVAWLAAAVTLVWLTKTSNFIWTILLIVLIYVGW